MFSENGGPRRFLLHGGTSFVVAIYILVECCIMAYLTSYHYGSIWYLVCIMMGLAVVAALFFESPRLSLSPRPIKQPALYDHVNGNNYVANPNVKSIHIPMGLKPKEFYSQQGKSPNDRFGLYWHPLTEFECNECFDHSPIHVSRPPRARHCHICNTCVLSLDHHCEFVNACIGEGNFPAFICFLIWSFCGLTLHKLIEFVLFVNSLFYYSASFEINATSSNEWLLSILSSGMTEKGLAGLHGVRLSYVGLLLLDFVSGCIVAGMIGMLFYQQIKHLIFNCTWPEHSKYRRLNVPMPYDYINDTSFGRIMATYLNISHRVWNGRGVGPSDQVVGLHQAFVNRRLVRRPWRMLFLSFIQVAHTFACYIIPQYWRLSGEALQHANHGILVKHAKLPNSKDWTSNTQTLAMK